MLFTSNVDDYDRMISNDFDQGNRAEADRLFSRRQENGRSNDGILNEVIYCVFSFLCHMS
jgi:hypothetical protein